MRSSSLAILIAASVSRRSTAMGWRSASSFSAWSSIVCCSCVDARVAADGGFGERGVAPRDGLDGVGELGFGQAAHLRHGGGQRFELFGERL